MKIDLKKYIPVALILLGVLLASVNLNDFLATIGAIMLIVGIAWLIIVNKKKPKSGEYNGAYIANPDSKIFHYPGCPSLEKINPVKNVVLNVPRSKLIKEGYKPCKKCDP